MLPHSPEVGPTLTSPRKLFGHWHVIGVVCVCVCVIVVVVVVRVYIGGRKDRESVVVGTTHFLLLLFYSTFYFYFLLSKWGETMVVPPFDSFVSHLVVTVTKEVELIQRRRMNEFLFNLPFFFFVFVNKFI